ncbi:MAG: hypothetical protein N0C81_06820 [Candidatus Thiodiazotropha lotti]|uniref:Uncharacterized protein n=1 Tax=Candidatus Thiodiazotropha lotti TaxID=2792787 RepID=A0A9E4K419_9GAMM|nr:hypothetical protein [Candidatus Thiodiazotropha lotti]ODC02041.1 hypothetical protein A3197_21105 [Candidatus Thiodiazotropha endoloripes]MCG7920428.1 hypothetical protein [Candidatus Thiodiazotropha lotti]MCG7938683.1 hypothetical protein [Candidatus Thiodiazotropha lotti]MCG8005889.1 hypothetical protein [Candidatus Thiodiazotropha lotti]
MRKKNTISDFHITIQLLWVFLWLPITGLAEPAKNLSESLRESLQQQGWQEYTAADGSVIYHQPKKEITTDIPSGNRETAEIRKFGEALQNHGWQVEWDSDNTLTLIPATTTSPSAKSPDPTPQISTAPSEAMRSNLPSDLSGFKYWNIERDQRGALLFHPVDISALKEQTEAATNIQQTECRIDQFQLASGSLPVDQWSEAQDVAKQWLNTVGATGLQVGRIRKINRIYLVSIVGESAPYPLKHQLAIRASDASVVLIE